jgi:hypothetical protein
MTRALVNLVTVLFVVLLVGAAAMWVRSEFTSDVWVRMRLVPEPAGGRWPAAPEYDYVVSNHGGMLLRRTRGSARFRFDPSSQLAEPVDERWRHDAGFVSVPQWTLPPVATWFSWPGVRAGHGYQSTLGGFGVSDSEIEFRYWLLVVLAGIVPAARVPGLLRARRRRRRQRRGRCAECGYDLRGGGVRCPECGVERTSLAFGNADHAGTCQP